MEIGYGIPNGLHENFEDGKEIKMAEFEEGELVEMISKTKLGENSSKIESQETRSGTENIVNKDSGRKKEKNNPGPSLRDMNRFVANVCKRLGERKSYLVWEAVAYLGISTFSGLAKEAEAIQASGGQKTTDGLCFRTGGRILWNIIKARKPNAYKEIIRRGLEFEMGHYKEIMKKFEKQRLKRVPKTPLIEQERTSQNIPGTGTVTDKPLANAALDGSSLPSNMMCDS